MPPFVSAVGYAKRPLKTKKDPKILVVIGLSELESNFRKFMQEQEVHAGTLVWGDVRK